MAEFPSEQSGREATNPVGSDGFSSTPGENGARDPRGEQSGRGMTGPTGPQGSAGESGSAGSQGEKGDRGVTGAMGLQGPKGEKGGDGQDGGNGRDSRNSPNHQGQEGQDQGVSNSNQEPDSRGSQRGQNRAGDANNTRSAAAQNMDSDSISVIELAHAVPLECPPSIPESIDQLYIVARPKKLNFAPGKEVTLMAVCSPQYRLGPNPDWYIQSSRVERTPVII